MKLRLLPALVVSALTLATIASSQAADPLKVLLLTGGCCHDYAVQKDILKKGIEERANARVDIIYTADYPMGPTGKPDATQPKLPIYGNPDYAKGYDVVIHDECASGISDEKTVEAVLAPHRAGIPGVNLHCAMHCYRIGNPNDPVTDISAPHAYWFEYLGLQSSRHDAQEPISVEFVDKESPITKGMADWTTVKEEHYNNIKVLEHRASVSSPKARRPCIRRKSRPTGRSLRNRIAPMCGSMCGRILTRARPAFSAPRSATTTTRWRTNGI